MAISDVQSATQLVAASSLTILTFWLSHRVAVSERTQPVANDSEATAELRLFRLLAVSLLLDVLLGFFYGFGNGCVRFLLFGHATGLSFCALAIGVLKWSRILASEWGKALECFEGDPDGPRHVALRVADDLLWSVNLLDQVFKRLRDYRNM